MSTCLVLTPEEKKAYKDLGVSFPEVTRDYLEKGFLRSPMAIKYKLDGRSNGIVIQPLDETNDFVVEQEMFDKKIAEDWVFQLSKSLGIEAKMITVEQAKELHATKRLKYSGENAFFTDGSPHFIIGSLTPESAVHEFAHPLVKSLSTELRDSLYDQLSKEEFGKTIIDDVSSLYENAIGSEGFKEEVLVRALTASVGVMSATPSIVTFVDKLLYAIKQALRRLLGRSVNVSSLKADTTLEELAAMLAKGTTVELQKELITSKDVIDYFKETAAFVETFENVLDTEDHLEVQDMIDRIYAIASTQIKELKDNSEYSELADLLIDDFDSGILNKIKEDLKDAETYSNSNLIQHISQKDSSGQLALAEEKVKERLKNFAHSLYKIEDLFKTMNDHLLTMETMDSNESVKKIIYYKNFIKNWETVVQQFKQVSLENPGTTPLNILATSLESNLLKANKQIAKIQTASVKDIFVKSMEDMAALAMDTFNKTLVDLKKGKGILGVKASQFSIDQHYRQFHNLNEAEYNEFKALEKSNNTGERYRNLYDRWLQGLEFNEKKAEAILNGSAPDSSSWNGMLESASLNSDPLTASLNSHIQNLISEYEMKAYAKYSDFVKVVEENHDKVSSRFQNTGALGKSMSHRNSVGKLNAKTGEVEESFEIAFLSKWKDYEYDKKVLDADLSNKLIEYRNTNSETSKKLYLEAKRKLLLWKNEFMNQEFATEYYAANDLLLKDAIGIDASDRRKEITDKKNLLIQNNEDGSLDDAIDAIDLEYKQLSSVYDAFGVMKTGRDLEVAERLTEYQKAKSGFTIEDEIPGAFQNDYNEEYNRLKDLGLDPESTEFKEKLENWLDRNTRVVLKNSVHEARQNLIAEKENLLSQLDAKNKEIYDTTALDKLIYNYVNQLKDFGNQPDGYKASEEIRDKVRKAHEELELNTQEHVTKSGLTKSEVTRYAELKNIYTSNNKKWVDPNDKIEFSELTSKKVKVAESLGLNAQVTARIKQIDIDLSELSGTLPTDYYKSQVVSFLNTNELEDLFSNFAEEAEFFAESLAEVPNEYFIDFLNSSQGKEAMELNADLKKWYDQNHYESSGKFKPTKIWMTNIAQDPFSYKTKMLKDVNGNNLGFIQINDTYRVPKQSYYVNVVKPEFTTKKIVGETVDNRGRMLPKNEPSNKYVNTDFDRMRNEDPDLFNYMEDLKKQHLLAQENAIDSDKLYLNFPKIDKLGFENVITGTAFTGKYYRRKANEFIKGREADVIEYNSSAKKETQKTAPMFFEMGTADMPIAGLQDINIDDVSTDILKTLPEYMGALMHKQGLREANGYARAVEDLVVDKPIDVRGKDNLRIIQGRASESMDYLSFAKTDKQKQTNRSRVIKSLVERDIEGKYLTGVGSENRVLQKTLSAAAKRSSKINFNWNPTSGLVNYFQMKVTAVTHALSSDEINILDGMMGEVWATKAALEVSRDIRSRSVKSLDEQLISMFDPMSGRTIETLGDSLSRTLLSDAFNGKMPQKGRKWLELQGTLQNFGALMHKKKIEITDEEGNKKMIPYLKAFELNEEGVIQSKKGVDPKYSITYDEKGNLIPGEAMLNYKKEMQSIVVKWNGAFAKKDAPLIARYTMAKQLMFLRKHVIPLVSKQVSFSRGTTASGKNWNVKKRMNWSTGKAEWGHLISSIKTMEAMVKTLGRHSLTMTRAELTSVKFVLVQNLIAGFLLKALYMLVTPMLSGDDDDDDGIPDSNKPNFAAMKTRSGYFEGPLTLDEDYYNFQASGYILNMLSMITLKTKDEYTASTITSPQGVMDLLSASTSQSIGITQNMSFINTALKLISGQKSDTPEKTGIYFYEKEGYEYGAWLELMFKFNGINGKMIDPTGAQKSYKSFQALK